MLFPALLFSIFLAVHCFHNGLIHLCKSRRPASLQQTMAMAGQAYFLCFLSFGKQPVALMTCWEHPSGSWTSSASAWVECVDGEWSAAQPYAMAATIGQLVLGLSAVLFVTRLVHRGKDLVGSRGLLQFEFVFTSFRQTAYWWRGFMMTKDVLFALTPLMSDVAFVQVVWAASVLLLYLSVLFWAEPFATPVMNTLEKWIHIFIALLVIIAGMGFDSSTGDRDAQAAAFMLVGSIGVSVPALCFVWFFVTAIGTKCSRVQQCIGRAQTLWWTQQRRLFGNCAVTSDGENLNAVVSIFHELEGAGFEKALTHVGPAELADLLRALRPVAVVGLGSDAGQLATFIMKRDLLRLKSDAAHAGPPAHKREARATWRR